MAKVISNINLLSNPNNEFSLIFEAAQVQAEQPLLTSPAIHTIQESHQTHGDEGAYVSLQSPSNVPSTSRQGIPVKLVVKKKIAQNHIEELNFRIQQANRSAQANDDINPSVGSTSDKDSDFNIQQLESTVSSLSGNSSSGVASPEIVRNKKRTKPPTATIGFKSIETDF